MRAGISCEEGCWLTTVCQGAVGFQQNLCEWGRELGEGSNVTEDSVTAMFALSGCPIKQSPNVQVSPPGPFCFDCGAPISAATSSSAGMWALAIVSFIASLV